MSTVRCLCGGQLTAVSSTSGDRARTVVGVCGNCNHHIAVQLVLRDLGVNDPRCGTDAGYQTHRRHSQTPCAACVVAHRTDMARRRQEMAS